jgi:hypothetical protein
MSKWEPGKVLTKPALLQSAQEARQWCREEPRSGGMVVIRRVCALGAGLGRAWHAVDGGLCRLGVLLTVVLSRVCFGCGTGGKCTAFDTRDQM